MQQLLGEVKTWASRFKMQNGRSKAIVQFNGIVHDELFTITSLMVHWQPSPNLVDWVWSPDGGVGWGGVGCTDGADLVVYNLHVFSAAGNLRIDVRTPDDRQPQMLIETASGHQKYSA